MEEKNYMKKGNISKAFRGITAFGLAAILMMASSMFILAKTGDTLMGEISVSGANNAFVTLNGDQAFSGRTFISSGTISTPEATSATVKLGKAGFVNLAPNSVLSLSFDEKNISGTLSEGSVKVFNSEGIEVKINTPEGIIGNNAAGESSFAVNVSNGVVKSSSDKGSVSMNNGKSVIAVKSAQDDNDDDGNSSLGPLLILAGLVTAAVVYVVINNRNDDNIVSPVR